MNESQQLYQTSNNFFNYGASIVDMNKSIPNATSTTWNSSVANKIRVTTSQVSVRNPL